MTNSAAYLSELHQLLNQHFNLAEICTLCLDLNVDYDSVAGEEKPSRIRELLLGLGRNGRLPELISLAQQQRPLAEWLPVPDDFELPESLADEETVVPINQYHIYGDSIQGDKFTGDKIGRDKNVVGDVSGQSVVAIGAGAAVYQGLTVEEVATLVVELKNKDQPVVWNGRIPYLGLNAYQIDDARYFFGRESLVEELLQRVQDANFITTAGPSGSGKSSVARAGLFHALRQGTKIENSDRWLLATMQPKGNPIEQLAQAIERLTKTPGTGDHLRQNSQENLLALHQQAETLLSEDHSQRFVLLVDQFEELFTQTKDTTIRQTFINLLTEAAQAEESRCRILISLRSDFVSNCASHEQLRELMSQQFQLVGAMAPRDLAKAITLPALEVGAEIDPKLVSQIIADMKGSPDALPLMSFALRDLFEVEKTKQGEPMDLTLPEYVQRGGLEKALEEHANKVFNNFTAKQKEIAKNIFSKLIEVGQGRVDTRRTATFAELVPAGSSATAVTTVLSKLADMRLVTTSDLAAVEGQPVTTGSQEATVTIAHEKMIDAWPWLRTLVDENRDLIALQNQINNDALLYAKENDNGFLYRGGRLIQVEEKLDILKPHLHVQQLKFIQESIELRQKEIDEREESRQRELNDAKRLVEATEAQRAAEERRAKTEALRAREAQGATKKQRRLTLIVICVGTVAIIAAVIASFLSASSSRNAEIAETQAAIAIAAESTSVYSAATARNAEMEAEANLLTATIAQGEAILAAETAEFEATRANANAALAATQESEAKTQTFLAESRALAAEASLHINEYRTILGLIKAYQSVRITYDTLNIVTSQAETILTAALEQARPRSIFIGHTGSVFSANFNSDGSLVVTAGEDNTARLWDFEGNQIAILEGHTAPVSSAVFNRDDTHILTTSRDGTARLWDIHGNLVSIYDGHSGGVKTAVFDPAGALVLTAGGIDNTAKLWNYDGHLVNTFAGHTDKVNLAIFNNSGSYVLTASSDGTAIIWDRRWQIIEILNGPSEVLFATFNHDNSRIITANNEVSYLWDFEGTLIAELTGGKVWARFSGFPAENTQIITTSRNGTSWLWDGNGNLISVYDRSLFLVSQVNDVAFNHDGSIFVTAKDDGTARIWDGQGNLVTILEGHTDDVLDVAFSQDGLFILTASTDGTVRTWNVLKNPHIVFNGHTSQVQTAFFNRDDTRILTTSFDGTARVWDMQGNQVSLINSQPDGFFGSASFDDLSSTRILTANSFSNSSLVQLWDEQGNLLINFEGHTGSVNSAVFNHNSTLVLSASIDNTARLWDINGNLVHVFEGHTDYINSAVFNHDSTRILTTSKDETARLWDIDGNLLAVLDGHEDEIIFGIFNNDGTRIITTSRDNTARLWDGEGRLLNILSGHDADVWMADFSQDGSRIVTASLDYTARLWDINGQFLNSLEGHKGQIWSVMFNFDGTKIVTGSQDSTIRLWDGEGNFITTYQGHLAPVRSVAFSHDGTAIVSSSDDSTIRIWEVFSDIEHLLEEAENELQLVITPDQCKEYFSDFEIIFCTTWID